MSRAVSRKLIGVAVPLGAAPSGTMVESAAMAFDRSKQQVERAQSPSGMVLRGRSFSRDGDHYHGDH